MKFSIVIPVYKVEKYLSKCLESILAQDYQNWEAIVVNDGSPDNCQTIIDQYVQKDSRIRGIVKENGGLSSARNEGVPNCTGDYLLFLDSDDYWNPNLLSNIIIALKDPVDIVKFQTEYVDEEGKCIEKVQDSTFSNLPTKVALSYLFHDQLVEPAWLYAYRLSFWNNNNFSYVEGRLHEDFGLTPYVLATSSSITAIPYIGYEYVQRSGSIMNVDSPEKNEKKAYDTLYQADLLIEKIKKANLDPEIESITLSFIANCAILKGAALIKKDKKEYVKKLKTRKITQFLSNKTASQKIKKLISTVSLSFYLNVILTKKF